MGTGVTYEQIVDAVHLRGAEARDPAVANLYPDEISVRIAPACELLAAMLNDDAGRRRLVEKSYTVNLTSGIGTVATADDLLWESIEMSTVVKAMVADPLVWVADRAELLVPRFRGYIYFTVEGQQILTCDTNGSLSGLTGSLTIVNGVYVPSVSDDGASSTLHPRLVDDLVAAILTLLDENPKRRPAIAPKGVPGA